MVVSKSKAFLEEKASTIDNAIDNRRKSSKEDVENDLLQAEQRKDMEKTNDKEVVAATKGKIVMVPSMTEVFDSQNNPVTSIGCMRFTDLIDTYDEQDFFERLVSTQLYMDHLDRQGDDTEEVENQGSNDTEIEEQEDISIYQPESKEVAITTHISDDGKMNPAQKSKLHQKGTDLPISYDSNRNDNTMLLQRRASDGLLHSTHVSKAVAIRNSISVLTSYGDYYDRYGQWSPSSPTASKKFAFEDSKNDSRKNEIAKSVGISFSGDSDEGELPKNGHLSLETARFGGGMASKSMRRSLERQSVSEKAIPSLSRRNSTS